MGYPNNNRKSNTGLIVAVTIFAVIVILELAFYALISANIISFGSKGEDTEQVQTVQDNQAQPGQTPPAAENTPAPAPVPQPIPVGRTMYIGNCNASVTLRTGPGTNYGEMNQIPLGEEIYVVEYTNDSFAKVRYLGSEGYIMRTYIVSVRPQVYNYDAAAVAAFVESSIYAFVNGVNTGSDAYVSSYYSGAAATEERNSVREIAGITQSEEVLSLNCHSVTRVSATQVTVIRDSVIRVVYNDGSVKDISERYKYTVDISGTAYRIVALKEM